MKTPNEVLESIQSYLGNGGLFNPEMMKTDKVRELIMDCRDALALSLIPTTLDAVEREEWRQEKERLETEIAELNRCLNSIGGAFNSELDKPNPYTIGSVSWHVHNLRTENKILQSQQRPLAQELSEAWNEAACCDDIPLDRPLAKFIGNLCRQRDELAQYKTWAESEIALLKGNLDEAIREHERMASMLPKAQKGFQPAIEWFKEKGFTFNDKITIKDVIDRDTEVFNAGVAAKAKGIVQ